MSKRFKRNHRIHLKLIQGLYNVNNIGKVYHHSNLEVGHLIVFPYNSLPVPITVNLQ